MNARVEARTGAEKSGVKFRLLQVRKIRLVESLMNRWAASAI
jgi:hypothetical protein